MKNLQEKFKLAASFLENSNTGLINYIFLFLAILVFRLCLEFFANQKLFTLYDVIHIGLWFLFIVLAFIFQLQFFSKVSFDKLLKLAIPCFSIALLAPIIDIIVSHGKFAKMNYLSIHSVSDFFFSYFTVGGSNLTRGATIGIRIEIILLMIASFNYIWIKRSNILIAVLGSLSIYTVLFLSGTIPFVINFTTQYFGLTYALDDHSTELLLFCLDLILILVISKKMFASKTKHPFSLSSYIDFGFCLGLFLFGVYLANLNYPKNWNLNSTTIYYFPILLVIFILTFRYINYKNQTSKKDLYNLNYEKGYWFLVTFSCLILSFDTFFALLLIWATLFLLYEKPTTFIKNPVISSVLKSILYITFLFLGFTTFGAPLIGINLLNLVLLLTSLCVIRLIINYPLEKYYNN